MLSSSLSQATAFSCALFISMALTVMTFVIVKTFVDNGNALFWGRLLNAYLIGNAEALCLHVYFVLAMFARVMYRMVSSCLCRMRCCNCCRASVWRTATDSADDTCDQLYIRII